MGRTLASASFDLLASFVSVDKHATPKFPKFHTRNRWAQFPKIACIKLTEMKDFNFSHCKLISSAIVNYLLKKERKSGINQFFYILKLRNLTLDKVNLN